MDQNDIFFHISKKVLEMASSLGLTGYLDRRIPSAPQVQEQTFPDELIQSAILEIVRERSTGWGVVSEEGVLEKGDGATVLIMDPLDGSYNAVNNIPFFSTSVALFDTASEELTHAMVIDLPSGRIYHSARGSGSYLGNIRLHTRDRPLKNAALSVYIGNESITQIGGVVHITERARYLGCDSLEMCLVAQGSLDGAIYFGRVPRKTDLAASMLIVRESGGGVFALREDGGSEPCRIGDPWEGIKGVVSLGNPANIQMLLSHYNDQTNDLSTGDDRT